MSAADQKAFLEKVEKIMLGTSREYRKLTNKRPQLVTFTTAAVRKGIRSRLVKEFPDSPDFVERTVRELNGPIFSLINKLKARVKARGFQVVRESKSSIVFLVTSDKKDEDNFNKAYNIYKELLKDLASDVYSKVASANKSTSNIKAGKLWNLEHNLDKGVLETYLRDQILDVINKEQKYSFSELEATLVKNKAGKRSLKVIRKDTSNTMEIFLGSQPDNREEGSVSRSRRDKLAKALRKAIIKLEKHNKALSTMKGSDSLLDVLRKKTIKVIRRAFGKKKNIKVNTKQNTKVKKGSRSASIEKKNKVQPEITSIAKKTKTKRPKAPKVERVSLLGILNEKINETVAKNMGSPALNYRTGRFASSVRIVDQVTTPKGFTSVGYTYQKYPYQTFEPGFAQGSQDRDPRRLIDKSIREIAISVAVGRLYTRRL